MEHISLAPDLEVARVITGLWQIADMERDDRVLDLDAAAAAIGPYADAGFTSFDMADHYGSAETIVGRYRGREQARPLQVLTKWVPPPGPVGPADVTQAVDRARRRLQCSRIDLLQFHTWNYADPAWLDALFALRDLQRKNIVRHIGLTNFDAAHLYLADACVKIVTNQVCCSLLDRRALGAMSDVCLTRGIRLLPYGTLAGGFLTARWLGRREPEAHALRTWSEMKYKRFVDLAGGWDALQNLLTVLDDTARRLDASMANVAVRWVLDQPAVGAVIVGARLGESEHIKDNGRLLSLRLDDTAIAAIDRAVADLQPIPGDCGDEYRKPPFLTASGDLSHHVESMPAPYATVKQGAGRQYVVSGTEWEELAGYSRAVRTGRTIRVSGTTALHGLRVIGGNDAAAQTHFIIDKIEGALQSLGAKLEHVVRTRIFVRHRRDWEPVARVHGHRFADIRPANTLVRAEPVVTENLVEIEAEAEL